MIVSTSFETALTIIPIVNVRDVNPIRIAFITKLPNELIKFHVFFKPAEDFSICTASIYVCVQIECSSFHMLTAFCTADSTVELRATIA